MEFSETEKGMGAQQEFVAKLRRVWPHVVELWIVAVLVTFFVLRVVESRSAQRILDALRHRGVG